MDNSFEDATFREFDVNDSSQSNVIKGSNSKIVGKTKINVEEDGQHGVKIILKKDDKDVIKEIKFMCSCGQSKSILLEYTDQ